MQHRQDSKSFRKRNRPEQRDNLKTCCQGRAKRAEGKPLQHVEDWLCVRDGLRDGRFEESKKNYQNFVAKIGGATNIFSVNFEIHFLIF